MLFGISSRLASFRDGSLSAADAASLASICVLASTSIADDNVGHAAFDGVDLDVATLHIAVKLKIQRCICIDAQPNLAIARAGDFADTAGFVAPFAAGRAGIRGSRRRPLGPLFGNLVDVVVERSRAAAGLLEIGLNIVRGLSQFPGISIALTHIDIGFSTPMAGPGPVDGVTSVQLFARSVFKLVGHRLAS
jgi:hypothetical protein